jgi:hypothetical protein
MAFIRQTAKGKWQAQVARRGVRDQKAFATRDEAAVWAANMEAAILGKGGPVIQLTPRELLDLHNRSKERARFRGIDHFLTREQVEALFAKSAGRCAVSGILFNRFRPLNSTKRPWYPSLDRINSRNPYTEDNCRFVCVAVNVAMGEWGEWALKAICRAMHVGEPAPLCEGPEAAPYSFPALGDVEPTYRQIMRRRQRERSREIAPQITHGTENGA